MSLTDRDRKLLLAPKREEATTAATDLTAQQQRLDAARAQAQAAKGAKQEFDVSYAQIVRLGKAIPSTVDMPSLLVQLDAAAAGAGIRFTKIGTGDRVEGAAATAPTTSTAPAGSESGTTGTPVAAGGDTAQSQPGAAAESANNAQQTANQASANAEQSGVAPADTQTSTPAGAGSTTGTTGATGTATAPAGLSTVPLELEFVGDFFKLSDFFHDIKRFVAVTNEDVLVSGRLLTVEDIKWASDAEIFPKIRAEITATIYLSPKEQGVTAGASPAGPTETAPTPADGSTPSTATPTATATP